MKLNYKRKILNVIKWPRPSPSHLRRRALRENARDTVVKADPPVDPEADAAVQAVQVISAILTADAAVQAAAAAVQLPLHLQQQYSLQHHQPPCVHVQDEIYSDDDYDNMTDGQAQNIPQLDGTKGRWSDTVPELSETLRDNEWFYLASWYKVWPRRLCNFEKYDDAPSHLGSLILAKIQIVMYFYPCKCLNDAAHYG